jgi:outer membrane protein
MRIKIFLFLVMAFFASVQAQKLLSPEDAVNIALKNNFDILIAQDDANIAKVNNTAGNAGMLPTVGVTGSDSYSLQYTRAEIKNSSASSKVLAANIALNWTLFDGGKMFVTKNKLNEIESLGAIQFKDKVLQTMYNVIGAYFDVVRQKQQLASLQEVIIYNQERVKILQTSFGAGLIPKTNLLQAKIDLNVYLENALNQESVIFASKRTLNQLLARDSDLMFEVIDSIPLNYQPNKKELIQNLYSSNTSILSFQKQVDIAKLSVKEFNTLRLPKFYLSSGYYISNTDNTGSSTLFNHYYGPSIGATISIPLYQAGLVNRQVSTSKLQLQSAEYSLENVKIQINNELLNALTQYEYQQKLLNIEKENDVLAKENLEISLERLRLGQTTSLETRQAQESYVDSRTRLLNFEYNLKVAETKLKQLIAGL